MYAIVNISGKQFRAEKGKSLKVPSQNTEVGKKLSYDQVLLTNDNGEVQIGNPFIKNFKVSATALENGRDKKIIVICSTLSPKFIENLKRKAPVNIELLDAPMSGASIAAKEARLTFMVGSTRKQFEYISPLLFFMGTNVFHLGEFGSGMAIKVLNNFVTASTVVSIRKVIYQARRMNIDVDNLLKTIDCSSGQNWFSSNRAMIEWFEEIYEKDNTIGILEKDVRAYVDAYENSSHDINGDRHFSDAVLAELNNLR